jgi:hypothetical protein
MLDPLFPFVDSDLLENESFHLFAGETTLVDSPEPFLAEDEGIDATLSRKVRDIIENQWGKRVEDLQDLHVGQFYERLVEDGQVSYRPVNRYVLQATFRYAQQPRRVIFRLTVSTGSA